MRISAINNLYTPKLNAPQKSMASNLAPLKHDTVSFSGGSFFKTRESGDLYEYYDKYDFIKSEILNTVPELKNKTFGIEEYNQLNENKKAYLRGLVNDEYEYSCTIAEKTTEGISSIKNDALFFIKVSDEMRAVFDNKNPQGYNLILLGGSPSIFSKVMEYQGHNNVKNIPFTRLGINKTINFEDYFAHFGLTNEKINSSDKKNIIFDYFLSPAGDKYGTVQGLIDALKSAKIELTEPELGKSAGFDLNPNLSIDSFISLFLCNKTKLSMDEFDLLCDYFLHMENIKAYSTCPRMNSPVHYQSIEEMQNDFEWSLPAKLINFALIDSLKNNV